MSAGVRRPLVAALLLALAAPGARAEGPVLRAEVDATKIGVEDQVQLTLTLEGGGGAELPLPPLENLRAVAGPFTSSQMSWVNGVTSQTRSATWVLQPRAVGKARVGAVTVDVEGGKRTSAPIEIEVVKGSLGPPPQAQRRGRPDPFADPFGDPFGGLAPGRARRGPEPKVKIRALADRTKLHVGEPLVVEFVIDTQASVSDLQLVEAPQFPGFWSEDLEKRDGPPNGEAVTADGESYRRFPLLRKLLFPTRSGTLTIPAATFRLGFPRESLFDPPRPPAERSSEPLSVAVAPLPAGAAAVGTFRAEASVDRPQVPLGEAVTLRFVVTGIGNLKWVEAAPELALAGAKVYPPQSKSEFSATARGLEGSRTWEWVVVPQTAGALEIPALALDYFDPKSGALARAESQPLRIEAAATAAGSAPAPARPDAAAPGLRADLEPPPTRLFETPAAVGTALALAALGHALLAWRPRALSRGPARDLRGQLERAARGGSTREELAGLVERALHERFGDLAAIEETPLVRDARALLADVQFLRYAPQLGDYSEKVRELAARAAALLRRSA